MVRNVLIILLLVIVSCKSQKPTQVKYDKLAIRNNYQLNYNLGFTTTYGSERYQYIVDVTSLDSGKAFNYTMTNIDGDKGSIKISENSLDTAINNVTMFYPGPRTLKDNESAVWLSRSLYEQLVKNDSAIFYPSEKSGYQIMYNNGFESYSYELNGVPQTIEVMKVSQPYDRIVFLILKDPKNPLIIRMKLSWGEIWLKEINHNYD